MINISIFFLIATNFLFKIFVIFFTDVKFTLKHFRLKVEDDKTEASNSAAPDDQEDTFTQCQKDVLNNKNDFIQVDIPHLEIACYYGVREFLVLVPEYSITEETKIKILLSSLTIAVSNTNW